MCQNIGNNIRHWRCDYRMSEKLPGKNADWLRHPVFGPITTRVHGKDEKNLLVSCCEGPADDTPPTVG